MTDWLQVVNLLDATVVWIVLGGAVAFCFLDQLIGIYYYIRSLF